MFVFYLLVSLRHSLYTSKTINQLLTINYHYYTNVILQLLFINGNITFV
jgi:hypothetical protein